MFQGGGTDPGTGRRVILLGLTIHDWAYIAGEVRRTPLDERIAPNTDLIVLFGASEADLADQLQQHGIDTTTYDRVQAPPPSPRGASFRKDGFRGTWGRNP